MRSTTFKYTKRCHLNFHLELLFCRRQFRYATSVDGLLMLLGSLAAVVHGSAWPVLNIVFGNLIDDFTEYGKNGTNGTVEPTYPPDYDPAKEFDDDMRQYAIIFSLIGAATMCFAYIQVRKSFCNL